MRAIHLDAMYQREDGEQEEQNAEPKCGSFTCAERASTAPASPPAQRQEQDLPDHHLRIGDAKRMVMPGMAASAST